ncbi:MAG: DMT family transporter [Proteobacteria bacterium]|nr:DMT family transporter [Pseudomonadota bacterium]
MLRGIALMLASAATFSVMQAIMRDVTQALHPLEALFFRSLFGALVLLPWLLRVGLSELRTTRPGLQALRVVVNSLAQGAFFWGVSLTPLAEVAALSFTGPLFATLGAVIVLGEVLRARRITALVVGFAGALLIVRPGFQEVQAGYLLILLASALWAVVLLVIKVLKRTESSYTMTFYLSVSMVVLSLPPALLVWRAPTLGEMVQLAAMGALGSAGQLLLVQSFQHADATALMPLDFTKLLWAAVLGYVLFVEVPDLWTLIGGSVIFASTTYITYREARLRKAAPAGRDDRE